MFPTKTASNLFYIYNAVAFLNAFDPQRLHFRYPDLQYQPTLQESRLISKLPNNFQYVAGNLAFSNAPNGKVSVYDLTKQEIVETENTTYCDIYDIVQADRIYIFGICDKMTTIASYQSRRFELITTMTGVWDNYCRTQTGDCYLFSGRMLRNSKSYPVNNLYLLADNQLQNVDIASVGIPEARQDAICFRVNARLFCVMDGVQNGLQLNDIWIFDQKQRMFMYLNRSLLRIQSVRKPYLQWKWNDSVDILSTISSDYAICRFGFPDSFDEIDWIRADRQVILKKCQEKKAV